VLELKSFHPNPLFFQQASRERRIKNYYTKFENRFKNDIAPFFNHVLSSHVPANENLKIPMYYSDESGQAGPVTVEFAPDYKPKNICGILVNEIKEYPDDPGVTSVVHIDDLKKFLSDENEWPRWSIDSFT
jgi:hypothetical protein